MLIQENINIVIENIINDFKLYPDKYLTESDVRCFLFNALMKINEFSELRDTSDGSKSTSVHTEVRWYGESGRLKWRSDVVILEVSNLRVKNGLFKLPSKGFAFNQPLAIIEIKLRRENGDTDNVFIKKIQEDIDKLKEIKGQVTGEYSCYLIVLDKKRDIQERIEESIEIKRFYKHSNFDAITNNNRQSSQSPRI